MHHRADLPFFGASPQGVSIGSIRIVLVPLSYSNSCSGEECTWISPGASAVTSSSTGLSDAGLVLVREVPGGSLEQVIYRMDAMHQLENSGVRLVNSPYAIEKMVDKYYALSLLGAAGLRVPETRITENPSVAMEAFHTLGGDVVLKPLFGSRGVGMVRLTDEENSAESGIDVVASPPGKKLQNVLLLSGGEKALTALSLLVGIFQYQPSPFCILDEVDAPLDEANIGRFTELGKRVVAPLFEQGRVELELPGGCRKPFLLVLVVAHLAADAVFLLELLPGDAQGLQDVIQAALEGVPPVLALADAMGEVAPRSVPKATVTRMAGNPPMVTSGAMREQPAGQVACWT